MKSSFILSRWFTAFAMLLAIPFPSGCCAKVFPAVAGRESCLPWRGENRRVGGNAGLTGRHCIDQTNDPMEGQVQIKKGLSDTDRTLYTDRAAPEEQVRGDDYIR